jgi:hypothetical protein
VQKRRTDKSKSVLVRLMSGASTQLRAIGHQQKTEKRIEKMNHNNIIRHHFFLQTMMHSAQLKTWTDTTNSTHNLSGWRGSTLFTILLLPFEVTLEQSNYLFSSPGTTKRRAHKRRARHTHALTNSICISLSKKKLIAYVENGLPQPDNYLQSFSSVATMVAWLSD